MRVLLFLFKISIAITVAELGLIDIDLNVIHYNSFMFPPKGIIEIHLMITITFQSM